MIEMKNDMNEEWCISVDYLFNWLLLYVCINECLKQVKEDYIHAVAKSYYGEIPDRLYNAMMMYEVKITD